MLDFLLVVLLAGALEGRQLFLVVVLAHLPTALVGRLLQAQADRCVCRASDINHVALLVVISSQNTLVVRGKVEEELVVDAVVLV